MGAKLVHGAYDSLGDHRAGGLPPDIFRGDSTFIQQPKRTLWYSAQEPHPNVKNLRCDLSRIVEQQKTKPCGGSPACSRVIVDVAIARFESLD